MKQTPIHDGFNHDLLRHIPKDLTNIIEVGSSSGALAREYKKVNPKCHYIGIEIDADFATLSRRYCDEVIVGNIETMEDSLLRPLFPTNAFVFGDVLEHLYDPWALLKKIRLFNQAPIQIFACIPNAQHWSLQVSLNLGLFVYQDAGLFDRTHIRWFTRKTIVDMFNSCGYNIVDGFPRIFNEPDRDKILPQIAALARAAGGNPDEAVNDALPLQYVIRAVSMQSG